MRQMTKQHTRQEGYVVPPGYISTANAAALAEYSHDGIAVKLQRLGCPYVRVQRVNAAGIKLGGHLMKCWQKDRALELIFTPRYGRIHK